MIRLMTNDDIPAVSRLGEGLTIKASTGFFDRPAFVGLVHQDDDTVNGVIMGWSFDAKNSGEVIEITVAADARRTGIGRALLTAFCDGFAKAQCQLEVRADNAAALSLYRTAGFVEDGRRLAYYALDDYKGCNNVRIDAVLMHKTASSGDSAAAF